MNHAARIAASQDNPEQIAKHVIRVLEQALRDEFGVNLYAGVELEYEVKIPQALRFGKHGDENPFQMQKPGRGDELPAHYKVDTKLLQVPDTAAAGTTHLPVREVLFPESPAVCYSYLEGAGQHGWFHYETVLSHLGVQNKTPFGEGRMNVLARATEALRKTIAHTPPQRTQFAQDAQHNAWLADQAHGITERNTSGFGPHFSHGMHVNVSFETGGGTFLSPALPDTEQAVRERTLQRGLVDIFNEGAYLLHGTDASLARAEMWRVQDGHNGVEFKDGAYAEICRPSADSNPYYALMLTLLGVYHTLKDFEFDPASGNFAKKVWAVPEAYPHALDYEEGLRQQMKECFMDGPRLLERTLNTLEPELGSRFMDAIERIPPGKEKSLQKAGIRFG